MKTIGDMGGVMTQLALATTGMGPRLPAPGTPGGAPADFGAPSGATGASGVGGSAKAATGLVGTKKKGGVGGKKEDTLLMDTKLKIVEILEV